MAAGGVGVIQSKIIDELGEGVYEQFLEFLNKCKLPDGKLKYHEEVFDLGRPERSSAKISFADLEESSPECAATVVQDYYRVYPFLVRAVKRFFEEISTNSQVKELKKEIVVDLADYGLHCPVRQLRADKVGVLVKITGQVVRTHPVHPELVAGTFRCLECQTVNRNVVQQYKFTLPTICRNPVCSNRTRFALEIRNSKFTDFQKLRIQEVQKELPRGAIPRTVEVILRAECVDTVQPGDRVDITGTLIVVPDVGQLAVPGARAESSARHKQSETTHLEGVRGLKALGVRDLTYRMAFLACHIEPTESGSSGLDIMRNNESLSPENLQKKMNPHDWEKIFQMSQDRQLYDHLIQSMFPTIHGNDEVKKGILLMLFGGVGKQTKEGTSLRGDINVCVVGDPSTAKSQFLRMVTDFVPRAVYTSGKASTAAGLTAAVVKDEESHEFVIEAGALMLADNGVCCIDEFDKMDYKDQVAIHEAMEQQTISITKAGVKATLNARTSILAAANPIGGRYDKSKSLRQNITLSAPLMSRFDLFFVLIDECDEIADQHVATRILQLHRDLIQEEERTYSISEVQQYIAFARQFKPKMEREAKKLLVREYVRMRREDANAVTKSAWRITVRQLESTIRLAEAMARLHCKDDVTVKHVAEAVRLIDKSLIRVEQDDMEINYRDEDEGLEEAQPEAGMDVDGGNEPSFKITYEEYRTIANTIVSYLREQEEKIEGGDEGRCRKSHVVNWYLDKFEADLDDAGKIVMLSKRINTIIDRLAKVDHILVCVQQGPGGGQEPAAGEAQPEEDGVDLGDPLLMIHPNYVRDDDI